MFWLDLLDIVVKTKRENFVPEQRHNKTDVIAAHAMTKTIILMSVGHI